MMKYTAFATNCADETPAFQPDFTKGELKFFHSIYMALWNANADQTEGVTQKYRSSMISRLFREKLWSWRVVGITASALDIYRSNNWKHRSGLGVQRSHLIDRSETSKMVFDRESPMSSEELLKFWVARDRTVLATIDENSNGMPQSWIGFANDGSLFTDKGTGYNFAKFREGEFLRSISK